MDPKERMHQELRKEAMALVIVHGRLMARHFTANVDAGTISDIRDGSVFTYIDRAWLEIPVDERVAWSVAGPDLAS